MNTNYTFIKERLCLERSKEGMEKRQILFNLMDKNKNGYLSYSEVDRGIKEILRLPEIHVHKDVIKCAFDAAKVSAKNGKKLSENFIEKNEFRYFLVYLRQYFEYKEMFNRINNDGDNLISYEEFVDALPLIEKWGLRVSNEKKAFEKLDKDKSRKVRFDEFCSWAIKYKLDIESDDDFTDDCLKNLK